MTFQRQSALRGRRKILRASRTAYDEAGRTFGAVRPGLFQETAAVSV